MHRFHGQFSDGGKAKGGTMHPNTKTRKPYGPRTSMNMQILQIFNTHVRCTVHISNFRFQNPHAYIMYIEYLHNKQTNHPYTYHHISMLLFNFPSGSLLLSFLNIPQCCSPSDFGSETIPLWPFDWPLFSCPVGWGWCSINFDASNMQYLAKPKWCKD